MLGRRVQGLTVSIARNTFGRPKQSILTKMATYSTNCVVGYATDVEGNLKFWNNYISTSKVLERRDGRLYLKDNCQFVYGGDVCDRGRGDIRVLTDLVNLKRAYPGRVHLIMGNRDINKLRLPSAMHPFALAQKPRCYWLRRPNPKILEGYRLGNRVDKMKWVLVHTMGSPLSFEYRRQELQDLGLPSDDESVVDSYLKLIEPDGLLTEYLELAKICVVIGDVVFVHGAFHEYNMGWVPNAAVANTEGIYRVSTDRVIEAGRKCGGYYLEDLKEWAECINNFALKEIKEYKATLASTMNDLDARHKALLSSKSSAAAVPSVLPLAEAPSDTEPEVEDTFYIWDNHGGYDHPHAGTRLLQYGMGWLKDKSVNPCVIYATYLEAGKAQPLGEQVRQWLTRSGIRKVVVGHQPNGDAPFTMSYKIEEQEKMGERAASFHVLSGDSSYSRNVQYRLQDLLADTTSAYNNVSEDGTQSSSTVRDEKWQSVDQFRTCVRGQEPCDAATETRDPNTMNEFLFFFPRTDACIAASSSPIIKGNSGALSYTGVKDGATLDEWTHIAAAQRAESCTDSGIVSAFAEASCDVLVHGRNSLEARFAFKLSDKCDSHSLSNYIGRVTKDGWYVKACGVVLPKDPEAATLASADLDQLAALTEDVNRPASTSKYVLLAYSEGQTFKSRLVPEHLIGNEELV